MGTSDKFIMPLYKMYLKSLIKSNILNTKSVRIAWLGQQNPESNPIGNLGMFNQLKDLFDESCTHDLFDIKNNPSWDVQKKWNNIKNYDVVLNLRLNYLVNSVSHLLEETKKAINNNGIYVTDFCSGNVERSFMNQTIGWKGKNQNLVAYLPRHWDTENDLSYLNPIAPSEDNILTENKLKDFGLAINHYHSYVCPKNRLNVIGVIEEL